MRFFGFEKITTNLRLTTIWMPVRWSKSVNSIVRNKFKTKNWLYTSIVDIISKKKISQNLSEFTLAMINSIEKIYQRLKMDFHLIGVIRLIIFYCIKKYCNNEIDNEFVTIIFCRFLLMLDRSQLILRLLQLYLQQCDFRNFRCRLSFLCKSFSSHFYKFERKS